MMTQNMHGRRQDANMGKIACSRPETVYLHSKTLGVIDLRAACSRR